MIFSFIEMLAGIFFVNMLSTVAVSENSIVFCFFVVVFLIQTNWKGKIKLPLSSKKTLTAKALITWIEDTVLLFYI